MTLPDDPIPADSATPDEPRLAGHNIVCFSTADWDTLLPTNKHQIMLRLARRNRVLFIETLGTRAPSLASGVDLSRIGRRLWRGFEGPKRRAKNLWSLSPVVRPAWGSALDRTINRTAFFAQARRTLARYPKPIVWAYSPYAVHLLDGLDPRLVVYHLVDDLSAVPGADVEALREAEGALLARADCVFCTEQSLHDRARRINPAAVFMPNVGDHRHFSAPPANVADPRLGQMKSLRRPRIVFSGQLAPHKVDLRLVERLATERPDWSFVLIGPEWEGADTREAVEPLRRARNVTLLGHVPYGELPAYLHAADALIIPYVRNTATRAVFPLKFFEYLATGKPVVASPLPSLLPYHEAVALVDTPRAWISAIEAALRDPDKLAEQRQVLARRHTWNARIRAMERVVGEALEGKTA